MFAIRLEKDGMLLYMMIIALGLPVFKRER
jgi:biotin transporter BioY